ncbi:hypothetical protein [Aquicoccus sp.]|uniref:hypothetical protein n=1 Tax=Aquicoccus sp. TaxID=2055851 RepID=UPI00356A2C03
MAIIIGIAVTLPPDTASAGDWRGGGGQKAMGLSSNDRAKLRRHIISKHHRPGRPVDPGFSRPWPGGHSSVKDKIQKEIRKDMRRRFMGKLVAGVVLGAIINVSRAGQIPGPPPRSDLCWAWSDNYRTRGYWTYCRDYR